MIADARVQTQLDAHAADIPKAIGAWLGRLCLLNGLPFRTIVPDARMLPLESIRFFFLDQNWVDALVDGALSVGGVTAQNATLLASARPHAHAAARTAAHADRDLRRSAGVPEPAATVEQTVWTGFLLRSIAVADWPGLKVSALDASGQPLKLLRVDRVSPTVLFAIFAGVVADVLIAKPAQTLHFGLEDEHKISLRYIGGTPAEAPGPQLPDDPEVVAAFRDKSRGTLDIIGTRTSILTGLANDGYGTNPIPPLNAGALGIELVAAAERQQFVPLQINSFTATPDQIAPGATSELAWVVQGADTCTIDQGIGEVDGGGDQSVAPNATTTWTLTATGAGATVIAKATVTVTGNGNG